MSSRRAAVSRRMFNGLAASAAWSALSPDREAWAQNLGEPEPFSFERLIERARLEAAEPYVAPPAIPTRLAELPYDQLVRIRFRRERAIWAETPGYQLQFIHLGAYLAAPVRVFTVQDGIAREVLYDPAIFDFGEIQLEPLPPDLGFAGLRIHYPLNADGSDDPLLVFLGASYFRALAKGARYGLSARGLALETGLGRPEEFPRFSHFWVHRPADASEPLVINALLESQSVVGAYRLDISPRDGTTVEVDASLFFRSDVEQVGLAPLTSMYYFGANDRLETDDWRPAVHDSGGLSVWRGSGELTWRPLVNPDELRLSVFTDENPRGFGLVQRDRDFSSFQDLSARYELRPNLWVQPKGEWGRGSVRLIEIPTPDQTNDNIVAFWTPEAPVSAGQELRTAYSLRWSLEEPISIGLASVRGTYVGAAGGPRAVDRDPRGRRIVIDFGPANLDGVPPDARPEVTMECHNGTCTGTVLLRNELTGGWRVMVEIRPDGPDGVELRCLLTHGGRQISETWLYRLDRS